MFNLKNLGKLSVPLVFGCIVWIHANWYVPKLADDLKPQLIKDITDSIKDVVLNELRHDGISLNLQLSKELNVPLNKVPQALSQSVQITDSAKKMVNLIGIVKELERVVDVGVKYDRLSDKFFYVSPKGIGEVFEDEVGYFRYTAKGVKNYLIIK